MSLVDLILVLVFTHQAPDTPTSPDTCTQEEHSPKIAQLFPITGNQLEVRLVVLCKSLILQSEIESSRDAAMTRSLCCSAHRAAPLGLKWDWETCSWCHFLTLDLACIHHSLTLSNFTSYTVTMREWKNGAVPWMQPIPPECCAIGRARVILPVLGDPGYPLDHLALFLLGIPLEM